MYFAQIDSNTKAVTTVCELISETSPNGNCIQIDNFDISLIGKFYNPEPGIFEEIILSVDKQNIVADGIDTVVVTAQVPIILAEATFYNADTGKLIVTQPVDPETHIATLQVTATTPGAIRIRAGKETQTRLNEVTINAA